MGYSDGRLFHSDLEDLLKGIMRDMVNSLVSKDFVYLSEGEGSGEFISVLHSSPKEPEVPVSQEIIEMLEGNMPVYRMRYSRIQMPSRPPIFELYCPYAEEMLILILTKRIPKLVNEISNELSSLVKDFEAESKQRWCCSRQPKCSDRRDCTCSDGSECDKSEEVKI